MGSKKIVYVVKDPKDQGLNPHDAINRFTILFLLVFNEFVFMFSLIYC